MEAQGGDMSELRIETRQSGTKVYTLNYWSIISTVSRNKSIKGDNQKLI